MKHPKRKTFPIGVGNILDSLLSRRKMKKKIEDCRSVELWADVVGSGIAEHTEARAIKDGVLKVSVSDHVWLQQLQFMKEEIRDKLNIRLGKKLVKSIFFQVGSIADKEGEPRNIVAELKKIKLDAEAKARIDDVICGIEDKEIKKNIKKAMTTEAKRRKLEADIRKD